MFRSRPIGQHNESDDSDADTEASSATTATAATSTSSETPPRHSTSSDADDSHANVIYTSQQIGTSKPNTGRDDDDVSMHQLETQSSTPPLTTSSSSSGVSLSHSLASGHQEIQPDEKHRYPHPSRQHSSYGRQQLRRRASPDRQRDTDYGTNRNDRLRTYSSEEDDEHRQRQPLPQPSRSIPQRTFNIDNADHPTLTSNIAVHETADAALIPPHSAFARSGLNYYPVSTFHLHPPAESVSVWDFEEHLFAPATLLICEGTHTFSLTIIANVGYRKENLRVSLEKDMLVVHGERDKYYEPVDDAGHCPSRRRIPLSFTRYIPLPDYVDTSSISAVYHKWKLHVYLSKTIELQKKVTDAGSTTSTSTSTSTFTSQQPSDESLIRFPEVNDFTDPLAVNASHDTHVNCDHTRHICHTASAHPHQLTQQSHSDASTLPPATSTDAPATHSSSCVIP